MAVDYFISFINNGVNSMIRNRRINFYQSIALIFKLLISFNLSSLSFLPHFINSLSMNSFSSSGDVVGGANFITFPCGFTKNLAKFQGITLA